MTKIDIYSGFLGAGKTTLIKKLLEEAYKDEKLVLIENEFGEIGIDGGFLAEAGIEINEMNSGCICCTLVGDFSTAMQKVITEFAPDRILIEPSGVGKLSDVAKAVAEVEGTIIDAMVAVVDARNCKLYHDNFGEFFNNQIEHAGTVVLSHTESATEMEMTAAMGVVRELNKDAALVATAWDKLTGKQIRNEFKPGKEFKHADDCTCGCHDHDHEHHHHDHDHEHEHEHHHDHDHEHEHHHHDHDHDHDCCGHDHDHEHEHHHHHHDHGDDCTCGCHDHDHDHHHHHADEVFTSVGIETIHKFEKAEIEEILNSFNGNLSVLRSKGMVEGKDGQWIFFDYVPGKIDIREGSPQIMGKAVVIGTEIDEEDIRKRFAAC